MSGFRIRLYKQLQGFHDPVVLVEEESVDGGEGRLDHDPHVSAGQILSSWKWIPSGKATLGSARKMPRSKVVVSLKPGSRKSYDSTSMWSRHISLLDSS